jgi:hypothetical protein
MRLQLGLISRLQRMGLLRQIPKDYGILACIFDRSKKLLTVLKMAHHPIRELRMSRVKRIARS